MNEQPKKGNAAGLTVIGVIVLILVGLGVMVSNKKTPNDITPVTTATDTNPATSTVVTIPNGKKTVYKTGSYSAEGSYNSPGGEDTLGVSITLVNDVVTDASATVLATDRESQQYQQRFVSGFKQYVIGKNIDEIALTKVSGASLTSKGFMDALDKIKAEAKA